MTLVQTGMNIASHRLPKVISPKAHAIIDYALIASWFAIGAFVWKRNRRAAVSAVICGGATAATAMFTDYPGGVWKKMSYQTHGKIDTGLVALVASMPRLMNFEDDREAWAFKIRALGEGTVTAMTDFNAMESLETPGKRKRAA